MAQISAKPFSIKRMCFVFHTQICQNGNDPKFLHIQSSPSPSFSLCLWVMKGQNSDVMLNEESEFKGILLQRNSPDLIINIHI